MIYIIFKETKIQCDVQRTSGIAVVTKISKSPICMVKTHAADRYLNKDKLRKVAAEFFGVPEASISVL